MNTNNYYKILAGKVKYVKMNTNNYSLYKPINKVKATMRRQYYL